ncbi:MAG TPA: penicillin-binding protein activator [Myxococcota bacterium]|nr:penicillin-binding protein activator [Myxococcota bacterium]
MSPRLALPVALLAGAALALAFGCARKPPPKAAEHEGARTESTGDAAAQAHREYEAARALADRDPSGAAEKLQAFIARWPRSPDVDAARLRLSQLERRRGHTASARAVADAIVLRNLSPSDRQDALRLLAALAGDAGDHSAQLVWLGQLRAAQPDADSVALVDVEIDELTARLDPDTLDRAADKLGDRVPAARLRLRQAELALQRRDVGAALLALAQASRLPLSADEAPRLAELERRTHTLEESEALARSGSGESGAAKPSAEALLPGANAVGTIGVVLPLSGQLARFGEESLQGILLAAGVFRGGSEGGVRILVRDSESRGPAAALAVQELAADPSVLAVLGPLSAAEAEAAAVQAEAAGLPLLTLSGRDSVTARRTHIFRLGVAPRDEATVLAEYAVHELGLMRFAVLHPDDTYGRGMRDVFEDAVHARGATVTGVAAYQPGTTDFSGVMRTLATGKLPTDEAPAMPFDALFIPDSGEKVIMIAPQLAFNHLQPLRLLGPDGWQHANVLKLAGAQLEGAVVAEPFDAGNPSPLVQEFVRQYQETMRAMPDVFAAQAFDAANLALAELSRGASDREALRAGLLRVHETPGVAGTTTIRSDGIAEKRASLLGVQGGRFVSLQGP